VRGQRSGTDLPALVFVSAALILFCVFSRAYVDKSRSSKAQKFPEALTGSDVTIVLCVICCRLVSVLLCVVACVGLFDLRCEDYFMSLCGLYRSTSARCRGLWEG